MDGFKLVGYVCSSEPSQTGAPDNTCATRKDRLERHQGRPSSGSSSASLSASSVGLLQQHFPRRQQPVHHSGMTTHDPTSWSYGEHSASMSPVGSIPSRTRTGSGAGDFHHSIYSGSQYQPYHRSSDSILMPPPPSLSTSSNSTGMGTTTSTTLNNGIVTPRMTLDNSLGTSQDFHLPTLPGSQVAKISSDPSSEETNISPLLIDTNAPLVKSPVAMSTGGTTNALSAGTPNGDNLTTPKASKKGFVHATQSKGKQGRPAASGSGNGPPDATGSSNHHPTASSSRSIVNNPVCLGCQATETPEWRRGPLGPRTLCNACGLVFAKLVSHPGPHPVVEPFSFRKSEKLNNT